MDLEVARKSLSTRNRFSPKKIAFAVVVCLVLVAGVALRASHYLSETPAQSEPTAVEAPVPVPAPAPVTVPAPEAASPPPAETTESIPKTPPATQESAPAPTEPAEQAAVDTAEPAKPEGDAVEQTEQADLPGAGMILVARKPVEVLASPSASAPAMYGFPAGRPFRVIGREGGFVQIQDLKSSASGWIDEAALAAPPAAPVVAAPSQSKPGPVNRKPATASADPKPKAVKKPAPVSAESEPEAGAEPDPVEAQRRPGLFGRGGLFGGIFGNGNAN